MSLKDIIDQSNGQIVLIDATPRPEYKSQAARDAEAAGYGDRSYWDYLEKSSIEHDELDRSLSESLMGNDGE